MRTAMFNENRKEMKNAYKKERINDRKDETERKATHEQKTR